MTRVYPVILTGGSGTRLWPASRKAYPKQFAPLLGKNSLYQATLGRFSGDGFGAPLVMTGEDFRFMAVEQAEATLVGADLIQEFKSVLLGGVRDQDQWFPVRTKRLSCQAGIGEFHLATPLS